jgi:hypothetical protein
MPATAASTINALKTKFAVCNPPPGPFASTLSGCRAKLKPSRINPWPTPSAR